MLRNAITSSSAAVAVVLMGTGLAEAGVVWSSAWGTAVRVDAVSEVGVADGCPIEIGRRPEPVHRFEPRRRAERHLGRRPGEHGSPWQPPRRLEAPINPPAMPTSARRRFSAGR